MTIEAFFEDHGDECATATPVNVEEPSSYDSLISEITPAGDWDYFKLVVPTTGILKVYTTGNTDTFGYLLDSGCDLIADAVAVNDDISGQNTNFKIVVLDITADTYYVAVK